MSATGAKQIVNMLTSSQSVGKLSPSTTAFFLCDIQERFRPLIYNSETIISTARYLTSVASALSIPVFVTQQYTKVFGPTVSECFTNGHEDISKLQNSNYIFDKKLFSMMTPSLSSAFETNHPNVKSVVLFGIEAHVCVQQTVLDLLEKGKEVHLVLDGVSSQQPFDREVAIQRMGNLSHLGLHLTTAQSLAFMLMQSADHEHFKTVSKLTVEHMKLPNEFNDKYIK